MEKLIPVYGQGGKVAVGAASAQSAALPVGCTYVMVWADTDCYVHVSSNPTATTSDVPVPGSKVPITIPVPNPGSTSNKVAVIQDSAAGSLKYVPLYGGTGW